MTNSISLAPYFAAQTGHLVDGTSQTIEHRIQFRGGALLPGRLTLAEPGGVRLTRPLFALALQARRCLGQIRRLSRGPPPRVGFRKGHLLPGEADRVGGIVRRQHLRRHTAPRPCP